MSQEEKEQRDAYTVMNAIDSGFVSAAALENDDALAIACATVLKNFIKGNDTLQGISDDYKASETKVLVPFTIYG